MFYLNSTKNSEDSLLYLENPSVSLKYPLRVGSNWDYVKNDNMEIKKSIIDILNVRTDAGSFECYKIKYIYKKSQITNNIECFEYYGSKGLIKREIYIDNISITDAYGRIIDNGKAIELIKLKDYTTKN